MKPTDIQALINHLKLGLSSRSRVTLRRPRRAGVLIPILTDGVEPTILLTRRAETLSAHRGEVAFPGGMWEERDLTIEETALREAEEEIGLPPDSVEVLGALDDLITKNTDIMVTPIIGVIRERVRWSVNPSEVARVFEVPLSDLMRPERWRYERRPWRGRMIAVFFFDVEGETLWGLSAHATLLTLSLLPLGSPVDLSEYHHQVDAFNRMIERDR